MEDSFNFRPLPLMKGCRLMAYDLTAGTYCSDTCDNEKQQTNGNAL